MHFQSPTNVIYALYGLQSGKDGPSEQFGRKIKTIGPEMRL